MWTPSPGMDLIEFKLIRFAIPIAPVIDSEVNLGPSTKRSQLVSLRHSTSLGIGPGIIMGPNLGQHCDRC